MKLLANSNGQELIAHSKLVAALAKYLAIKSGCNEKIQKQSYIAGLLHDCGKVTKSFQDYMKSNKEELENDKNKDYIKKPFHHELSWFFLQTLEIENKTNIEHSVFFHHSTPCEKKNKTPFRKRSGDFDVSKEDYDSFFAFINGLNEKEIKIVRDSVEQENISIPSWMSEKNLNSNNLISLGVVICADRFISSLTKEEFCIVSNDFLKIEELPGYKVFVEDSHKEIGYAKPDFYDNERWLVSEDCATKAIEKQTTIVNAPAGFGKTSILVSFGLKTSGSLIVVLPDNTVAVNLYESVIKELKNRGISNVSVELYTASKRQDGVNCDEKEFSSKFIITNIDNYTNPFYKNEHASRMFKMTTNNVVFDEYHNFTKGKDGALFALFIELMNARHNSTNAKTLLLSATGMGLERLWDNSSKVTQILPAKGRCFSPVHDKKYEVSFSSEMPKTKVNTLTILNSISNCQEISKNRPSLVYHSEFTKPDRKDKFNVLIEKAGKNANLNNDSFSCNSTLITSCSIDSSFIEMQESVLSPEETVQRTGRCNRHGQYSDCKITFHDLSQDRGESAVINLFYTKALQKKWYNYLKTNIDGAFSLKELYGMYFDFNLINEKEISEFLTEKLKNQKETLCKELSPKKFPEIEKKHNKNGVGGKNARKPVGSNYYVVYEKIGGGYSEPMTVDGHKFNTILKNSKSYLEDRIKIVSEKYPELKSLLTKGRLNDDNDIRFVCRKEDSPFPVCGRYEKYDTFFGPINEGDFLQQDTL